MPAPEANFQAGQPVAMNFLSDAMITKESGHGKGLTDFIIMATICGWAFAHRQKSMIVRLHSNPMQSFWERHSQIDAVLASQVSAMTSNHPRSRRHVDPISMFTQAMAQTMTMYMYRLMVQCQPLQDEAHQALTDAYSRTFCNAVIKMSTITETLAHMSCFKVSSGRSGLV